MQPAQRIQELTALLAADRRLWAERPFTGLPLSWEADYPEVATALRALNAEQVEAFQRDPLAWPDPPPTFVELAERARRLSTWPDLSVEEGPAGPAPREVPGRKWAQIAAFAQAVQARRPAGATEWLEWCAGKGHLARWLGRVSGLPVTGVELRPRLCDQGTRLADEEGVEARFEAADVLSDTRASHLGPTTAAVALHACGELHATLLRQAAEGGCALVAVAPCCYHRFGPKRFEPLSEAGRRTGLELEHHHLRLVGFDEVVASPARRARREREETWRLAFDLLQREASGGDSYRPIGHVPPQWLGGTFQEFCQQVAQREGIDLPAGLAGQPWERRGAERRRLVRALGTVRAMFRRPLESWLFADRVMFLIEAGFEVEAGTFCRRQVTPRNLLLVATAHGLNSAKKERRERRKKGTEACLRKKGTEACLMEECTVTHSGPGYALRTIDWA